MAGVNKVILVGNLGADPEVNFNTGSNPVATFRIATTESWKDKQGQKQERTEWHRIVAWGKLAELAGEYLSKGRQVYIEGKIQTRKWQDKSGNDRYTTEIVAQNLTFLGAKPDSGRQRQQESQYPTQGRPGDPPPPQRNEAGF